MAPTPRLVYRKGVDLMVQVIPEICQQYPHVDFIVAGDGPRKLQVWRRPAPGRPGRGRSHPCGRQGYRYHTSRPGVPSDTIWPGGHL